MGRWLETYCGWCRCAIPYLPEWSHIPEYCKSCNEWEHKSCANPHCGGTVKYKCYWNNIHDYCECNGWYEIRCENNKCFQKFSVNCNWDHPPQYCSDCRGWLEKPCDSSKCNGTVRYKAYWDSIPDYCSCKGWYEEDCKNSHCNGKIRAHISWNNPPQYCTCKGWYKGQCDNKKCHNLVDKHHNPRQSYSYCDYCEKMLRRRGYKEIVTGTRLEAWLYGSTGGNVRDDGDSWHVSIYLKEGGHISGNVDKYSTETSEVHGTLYAYDENGKRIKGEDIIINE